VARAAGLAEKADALLREVVHDKTGTRPIEDLRSDLDGVAAKLRSALGMRPKRKRAKNPRPTAKERLIVLLEAAGLRGLDGWKVSQGYWLRDQADVMRWECRARHWGTRVSRTGFHVGSWASMSDCVRYGITVIDGEKDGGGYCDISVEANYQKGRSA
jgi:hypothetical protein